MPKYIATFRETVIHRVEIEADSIAEARLVAGEIDDTGDLDDSTAHSVEERDLVSLVHVREEARATTL